MNISLSKSRKFTSFFFDKEEGVFYIFEGNLDDLRTESNKEEFLNVSKFAINNFQDFTKKIDESYVVVGNIMKENIDVKSIIDYMKHFFPEEFI